jgi:hypothetical protein
MAVIENTKILFRGDTAENWRTINPVLGKNETVVEWNDDSTVRKIKIGDGISRYNDLPYAVDEHAIKLDLEAEAATRGAVDTAIIGNLATEAETREGADTTLQGNIDTEASTRAGADTTLQGNIDTVTGNLATEAETRESADTTLQNQLDDLRSEMPIGYIVSFEFQPSLDELAAWRCLPLQGGVYEIARYQRLCDKMYVGNAANATADWWYKCDSEGNRTPTGAYMRVLDHRGLFSRAAGQNSKYKMANDAPYDGMAIGAFSGDKLKKHTHSVANRYSDPGTAWGDNSAYPRISGYNDVLVDLFSFAFGDNETAPASISAYLCIKY